MLNIFTENKIMIDK